MPLETPLFGRFIGENKRLIFAPAKEYLILVGTCVFGGLAAAAGFFFAGNEFGGLVSTAVCLAGIWGALSLQWISFDIKRQSCTTALEGRTDAAEGPMPATGTYIRREGPGLFPRTTKGSLDKLEAIFLLAEERVLLGRQVTYRLVLQWKGMAEISMVLQQDYRSLAPGAPINAGAAHLRKLGLRASQLLGIHFVDHSHTSTANPVPVR